MLRSHAADGSSRVVSVPLSLPQANLSPPEPASDGRQLAAPRSWRSCHHYFVQRGLVSEVQLVLLSVWWTTRPVSGGTGLSFSIARVPLRADICR